MSWRSPLQRLLALEFQNMANQAIRNEMRSEFQRALSTFDILEQEVENRRPYRSAAVSGRKDVGVRSEGREPFSAFDEFDDLFRSRPSFDQFDRALNSFDSVNSRFDSLQSLADEIKQDMDKCFKESAESFEGKEEYPTLADPDHTTYYKRVETNDNGHIRIKTISKKPGSDWETKIEEHQGGKPAIEAEGKQALEDKETPKQTLDAKKDTKTENLTDVGEKSGSKSSGSGSASARA